MLLRRALICFALLGALAPSWAPAEAKDARIVAVFRTADCRSEVCVPGSDPALADGAVVAGSVQIHVSASADLGLEWVRLEARPAGDPEWYCLEFWNAGRATTFTQHRTWVTPNWTDPRDECAEGACSSCAENSAHQHGEPSENIAHEIRITAREQGANVSSTPNAESPAFRLQLANGGPAPKWVESPKPVMKDGRQVVQLAWAPSTHPGVAEYRFVREDPDGAETTFAVAADDPSRQRCAAIGTAAIRCVDETVSQLGGTVRYAVAAYRTAPAGAGQRCALSNARCVRSSLSAVLSVTVPPSTAQASPPPQPVNPDPGATGTAPAIPTPEPTTSAGAPVIVDDPGDDDQIAAAEPAGATGRLGAVAVLALLLVVGVAGAAGLAKRRARKEPGPPTSNPEA